MKKRGLLLVAASIVAAFAVLLTLVGTGTFSSSPSESPLSTPPPAKVLRIVTENGDSKFEATVFVAEIAGVKYICGIEHTLNKTVSEINGALATGPFSPIGNEGGSERILCAPANTIAEGYKLDLRGFTPTEGITVTIVTIDDEVKVTVKDTRVAASRQHPDKVGKVLVTSGGESIVPSDSGAPVLAPNGEVFAVVVGGTEDEVAVVPLLP